jgi:hypothetical protein
VGEYSAASPQATQVRRDGVLLTPATYTYEDGVAILNNPNDYQYVFVDAGDVPGAPIPLMTDITLTVPATAGEVYQLTAANVDANQDVFTSERLNGLLDRKADQIYAVFYGHRGTLHSSTETNILHDETRDIYFVNNNLAIPTQVATRGGPDPFASPLVYSVMDFSAITNQLSLRRWNSTAGTWLENTHPDADHTLVISYPRQLDFGDVIPSVDGRTSHSSNEIAMRGFVVERDISEVRPFDPAAVDPNRPYITDALAKEIVVGHWHLQDKSLSGVQPGDGLVQQFYLPAGTSNSIG